MPYLTHCKGVCTNCCQMKLKTCPYDRLPTPCTRHELIRKSSAIDQALRRVARKEYLYLPTITTRNQMGWSTWWIREGTLRTWCSGSEITLSDNKFSPFQVTEVKSKLEEHILSLQSKSMDLETPNRHQTKFLCLKFQPLIILIPIATLIYHG